MSNVPGKQNAVFTFYFRLIIHNNVQILNEKAVCMVVHKDIKDNILNAIYKEMGMAKKAQGIAFSMPVTDTAGLVKIDDTAAEE